MTIVKSRLGVFPTSLVGVAGWLGMLVFAGCTGGTGNPMTATIPTGNRPPSIRLTAPAANTTVEGGSSVGFSYEGEDGEDTCKVVILVDRDQTPNSGNELVLRSDLLIGPGAGSGQIQWNTTGVTPGTYYPYATIDDGFNALVTAAALGSIQVVPTGTKPLSSPPAFVFLEPVANLGVASGDTVQLRYQYRDLDSSVKVTLLLDKDQNPNNDNVDNPGDPLDPNTNIILFPTEPRRNDDAVLPPDLPGAAPANIDSIEIRTNPRTFPSIPTGGFSTDKLFLFTVDFSKIPVRQDGKPYFLRATISDGSNPPVHVYANSPLTITGLASGFVDLTSVGVTIAGARFQGFSEQENLGSVISGAGDGDLDSINDFILGGRFGSPRNRSFAGSAYLIRGRRKLPFPPDTNTNGLPDQADSSGVLRDFPVPPLSISRVPTLGNLYLPYQPQNVGRFGGTISINSLGSFFRGFTIGMPQPHSTGQPPTDLQVPEFSGAPTAGLTSIAAGDFVGPYDGGLDGIPDIVLGLPFVSGAYDFTDDDPCDGDGAYFDGYPNPPCENGCPGPNDHMFGPIPCRSGAPFDTGMVIILSGATDYENDSNNDGVIFRLFVDATLTGQGVPGSGGGRVDDEGIGHSVNDSPLGCRWRGAWFGQTARGVDLDPPIQTDNEYGRTVARYPSFDNDRFDELLISVPNHNSGQGRVDVIVGRNYGNAGFYGTDGNHSLPGYTCLPFPCIRALIGTPPSVSIYGVKTGDHFGYAGSAGQINQDGTTDLATGAPTASRDKKTPGGAALVENGVTYVIFTPAGGFGTTELPEVNVDGIPNGTRSSSGGEPTPRIEIHGSHNGDHFGAVQGPVGDINGDGIEDFFLAASDYDDDILGNIDAGYVGVIFGARPITGENVFFPEQVATPALSGVRFTGTAPGAHAGTAVSRVGDFNKDGFGDFLISSPGETRIVNGQLRLGVSYLVFGGTHLINKTFNLSQVASPELPGIVFVSPYVKGTADEGPLENVGGVGDVDGDGFDDIVVAAPHADFIDPASPNQRRVNAGEAWLIYGSNFGTNKLP